MAATKNTGGPAFPCGEKYETCDLAGNVSTHSKAPLRAGMSLRDYFAAKAMLGIMTEPISDSQSLGVYLTEVEPGDAEMKGLRMARAAYVMADAMLRAREEA